MFKYHFNINFSFQLILVCDKQIKQKTWVNIYKLLLKLGSKEIFTF